MYWSKVVWTPDGSSGDPYSYQTSTATSWHSISSQGFQNPNMTKLIAHPTKPYFYFVSKYPATGLVGIWKIYASDTDYAGFTWPSYSNVMECEGTDYNNTSISSANFSEPAIAVCIDKYTDSGTDYGRVFFIKAKKIHACSFSLEDDAQDGTTSTWPGSDEILAGSFNEVGAINSGTTESDDLGFEVHYEPDSENYWMMHNYWDSVGAVGRTYYGILPKSIGRSAHVTTELSDYWTWTIEDFYYSPNRTATNATTGGDVANGSGFTQIAIVTSASNNDTTSSNHYALFTTWSAGNVLANDTYIGIAQSSVSADASVTVKLAGTEDANQSGLTTGQVAQINKSTGAISTTGVSVVTSTHKEIGVASSATKVILT